LSKDQLLEALSSSFLVSRAPSATPRHDKPARPAFTILPRYHQSRMVRRVADDAL
jgi:type I restriction enzyme R subunit